MSRYIPANAETRDFPAAVVIAYCFEGKPGSMTGKATPKPGHFVAVAKEETRRACGVHILNGGKMRGRMRKWDGTPRRVTWYA